MKPLRLDELAAADVSTQRSQAAALVAGTGDEATRGVCTAALEELGPPAAVLLPDLVVLTESEAGDVAYWAATLLGRLGAVAAPAVDPLTRLAVSQRPLAARERAVWALGEIGPPAADAAPTLELLSESDQPRLARLAKTALGAVRNPSP